MTCRAKPGGRNPEVDFHGQQRRNETHHSTTDPEARLAEEPWHRGQAELHGPCADGESERLIVDVELTQADGHAERQRR